MRSPCAARGYEYARAPARAAAGPAGSSRPRANSRRANMAEAAPHINNFPLNVLHHVLLEHRAALVRHVQLHEALEEGHADL